MSQQYDLESAFDITGLNGLNRTQFIQYILKLGPLSNIGLIIVMSGANNAHPDVTSNPRFARYLWIDIQDPTAPVTKVYAPTSVGSDTYADWVNQNLVDGSVTASKIDRFAVTVLTSDGLSRIALKYDATADSTKSTYLLRIDSNGKYVEVVSAASVVNNVPIPLSQLVTAGATNGMIVTYDSTTGLATWSAANFAASIGDNTVAYGKLLNAAAGDAGFLLRANPTAPYNIELVSNSDKVANDLLAIRSVRLNRLDDASAVLNDRIRFDGTNWIRYTPFYGAPTSGGTVIPVANGGGQLLVAHGLGAVPKRFGLRLINNSAEINYAVGDAVDGTTLMFLNNGGTEITQAVTVAVNATNIFANFRDGGGAASRYCLVNNVGYARSNIVNTKWDAFFWAEL